MRAIRLNPPSRVVQRAAPRPLSTVADRDFLPPALGLVETPPAPVFIALMLTICAFTTGAIAWSWFGRIDVIAASRGKIEPQGHIKVVQPLDVGKVLAVPVVEGQRVKAGEVLLRLDAREVEADRDGAAKAEADAEAEAIRREAAIRMIGAGCWTCGVTPAWTEAVAPAARAREEAVLRADLREIGATLANLGDQAAEKSAALDGSTMNIEAQRHLTALSAERLAMKSELLARHVGSRSNVIDAMQAQWEAQERLVAEVGKQGIDKAALASVQSQKEKLIQVALADQIRKMADARRLADLKASERAKAEARLDHATLRAPVDGLVQNLAITTPGQVVAPGQELMRLVPEAQPYEVQAYVSNEDIGFIKPGQEAVVKVDAFPFTRYGTLTGRVTRVSHDAVPASAANDALVDPSRGAARDAQALTPTARPTTDLVFEIVVALEAKAFTVDGQAVPLSPGMSLSVEIKTGSRRIIDYVFSPLVEVAGTAMRER